MADLEGTIRMAQEAIKATPEDHPDRAREVALQRRVVLLALLQLLCGDAAGGNKLNNTFSRFSARRSRAVV